MSLHSFTFNELIQKSRAPDQIFKGKLLALDPGETTGWAFFDTTVNPFNRGTEQISTWPIQEAVENLSFLVTKLEPDFVVFESYNIYSWKSDNHKQSNVPTIQVIGTLQTLLVQRNIPWTTQNAQTAKGFVTDDKLKSWGYYERGKKHGRDACRHACYWLLFGTSTPSP